jgi:hypothetical protein
VTSAPHGTADLTMLVKAWEEPREVEGLEALLRGSIEVLGSGDRPSYWGSVRELHETIDAALAAGFPGRSG